MTEGNVSKNKWAILCGAVTVVLGLFGQQLAEGVYPLDPVTAKAIAGIVALVSGFVTAFSPFFDVRQATK